MKRLRLSFSTLISTLSLFAVLCASMYNHLLSSFYGLNIFDLLAVILPIVATILIIIGSRPAIPYHAVKFLLFLFFGAFYYIVLATIFVFSKSSGSISLQDLAPNFRYFIAFVITFCVIIFIREQKNPIRLFLILIFFLIIPHFFAAVQQGATVYLGIGSPANWIYIPERREGLQLTWSVAGFADNQFSLAAIGLFVTSFSLAAMYGAQNLTNSDRITLVLTFLMAAIIVLLTGRRLQSIALFFIIFVLFITIFRRASSSKRILSHSAGLVLIAVAVLLFLTWLSQYTNRFDAFAALLSGDDDASLKTYNARMSQIDIFLTNIAENPFGTLIFPSNLGFFGGDLSFFSQWLWGGLPGLLFYFLLHFILGVSSYRVIVTSGKNAPTFPALFMLLLVAGFFVRALGSGGGLQTPSNFLYWIGTAFFLSYSMRKKNV